MKLNEGGKSSSWVPIVQTRHSDERGIDKPRRNALNAKSLDFCDKFVTSGGCERYSFEIHRTFINFASYLERVASDNIVTVVGGDHQGGEALVLRGLQVGLRLDKCPIAQICSPCASRACFSSALVRSCIHRKCSIANRSGRPATRQSMPSASDIAWALLPWKNYEMILWAQGFIAPLRARTAWSTG